MKKYLSIIIVLLLAGTIYSQNKVQTENELKELVLKSYVEGLIEFSNSEAAKKGIHPEFHLIVIKENGLIKYPLQKLSENLKDYPYKADVKCQFEMIDISGRAAVVKIKLTSGSHSFTDYLSCYKFKDGWKVVSALDNPD